MVASGEMTGVDLPERVGIRNIDDVLGVLSGLQTILHERRSEDGGHCRGDQHDQSGGLKRAGHD